MARPAQHHDDTSAGAAITCLARRDTLNGMETPGSAPSAQTVPDTTGPDTTGPDTTGPETSGPGTAAPSVFTPDMSEPDTDATPGTDAPQAASGPVWRFLIEPRWLAWHLFAVVAFWGMLWLGDWQAHRALAGNGLSWAYTFEWPLFAVFGAVFWARTIRDEFRLRRPAVETDSGDEAAATGPVLPEGIGTRQIEQPADDADDTELASYNAYLAKLNSEVKGHNKWLSAR